MPLEGKILCHKKELEFYYVRKDYGHLLIGFKLDRIFKEKITFLYPSKNIVFERHIDPGYYILETNMFQEFNDKDGLVSVELLFPFSQFIPFNIY